MYMYLLEIIAEATNGYPGRKIRSKNITSLMELPWFIGILGKGSL